MKMDKMSPDTRDAKCRAILSTKSLITLIAQELIPEFKNYSREEIYDFIEPGIETKEKVIGLSNEDGITQRDVVFFMKNPMKEEKIGIIINMEMQLKADASYPLVERAFHNVSRMITGQKGVVFNKDEYGDIAKVYSIWILPLPRVSEENTIAYYDMRQSWIEGEGADIHYDLFGIFLIRLGNNSKRKVLQVLNLIFKTIMEREEKIRILEEVFDVHLSEEAKEEVTDNLMMGEWFREEGLKQGIQQERLNNIKNIMSSFNVDLEKAMASLNLSEEEKEEVRKCM